MAKYLINVRVDMHGEYTEAFEILIESAVEPQIRVVQIDP